LKRTWFQNKRIPHYDLTANKRRQAVSLGATEVRNFLKSPYRNYKKRNKDDKRK